MAPSGRPGLERPGSLVPSSPMRAAIGRRMTLSKQQAPHFYVSTEIDMEAALDALAARREDGSSAARLTLTTLLIRAVASTLVDEPRFNAHWTGDGLRLIEEVNVGVAIALEDGLIAPALLDCRGLDLSGLSAALDDLVGRARAGRLRAAEISAATFTVSNLGMFDVSAFTAIINPPQVAILATGRTEPRVRVIDGRPVVRRTLTATLSADHRAVDGAMAARFLERLKGRLQAPES